MDDGQRAAIIDLTFALLILPHHVVIVMTNPPWTSSLSFFPHSSNKGMSQFASTGDNKSVVSVSLGTMTIGAQTSKEQAAEQLIYFNQRGYHQVDTARMYCHGLTEEILGELCHDSSLEESVVSKLRFSSKANAFADYNKSLAPESVREQSDAILTALQLPSTDIFYLHAPDIHTPIEDTLAAIHDLYLEKRFRVFGLSNYAAWEVVYIHSVCKMNGWVLPTVYQGMYNAVTRDVEKELFPALKKLNMSFNAYNPLCGGLLSGKHSLADSAASAGTRFDDRNVLYRQRYWKPEYFQALECLHAACLSEGGDEALLLADCSLRWLTHHSALSGARGDGVIIGASCMEHLKSNLDSCEAGPLSAGMVEAFERAWEATQPVCEKYFRP